MHWGQICISWTKHVDSLLSSPPESEIHTRNPVCHLPRAMAFAQGNSHPLLPKRLVLFGQIFSYASVNHI